MINYIQLKNEKSNNPRAIHQFNHQPIHKSTWKPSQAFKERSTSNWWWSAMNMVDIPDAKSGKTWRRHEHESQVTNDEHGWRVRVTNATRFSTWTCVHIHFQWSLSIVVHYWRCRFRCVSVWVGCVCVWSRFAQSWGGEFLMVKNCIESVFILDCVCKYWLLMEAEVIRSICIFYGRN